MPRVILNVPEQDKQLWVEAAHHEYISLSEWLRRAAATRLTGADAGSSRGRAVSSGEDHPSKSSSSRASVPASRGLAAGATTEKELPVETRSVVKAEAHHAAAPAAKPCAKQALHHIYHSGKPCPSCGYPQ